MHLKETIKTSLVTAIKAKDEIKKNIYRVILGEVDTLESRQSKKFSDDEISKIIRKLLQSNTETISFTKEENKRTVLKTENQILETLLPKTLSIEEILRIISKDDLKDAKSDGQAIGFAMKILKGKGLNVNGEDVKTAVTGLLK